MAQNWMAPWLSLWSGDNTTNFPSGDVSQRFRIFSPQLTVNGKGDPELEARIVRDVATYGAQIGQLSDIVLALADGKRPPPRRSPSSRTSPRASRRSRRSMRKPRWPAPAPPSTS